MSVCCERELYVSPSLLLLLCLWVREKLLVVRREKYHTEARVYALGSQIPLWSQFSSLTTSNFHTLLTHTFSSSSGERIWKTFLIAKSVNRTYFYLFRHSSKYNVCTCVNREFTFLTSCQPPVFFQHSTCNSQTTDSTASTSHLLFLTTWHLISAWHQTRNKLFWLPRDTDSKLCFLSLSFLFLIERMPRSCTYQHWWCFSVPSLWGKLQQQEDMVNRQPHPDMVAKSMVMLNTLNPSRSSWNMWLNTSQSPNHTLFTRRFWSPNLIPFSSRFRWQSLCQNTLWSQLWSMFTLPIQFWSRFRSLNHSPSRNRTRFPIRSKYLNHTLSMFPNRFRYRNPIRSRSQWRCRSRTSSQLSNTSQCRFPNLFTRSFQWSKRNRTWLRRRSRSCKYTILTPWFLSLSLLIQPPFYCFLSLDRLSYPVLTVNRPTDSLTHLPSFFSFLHPKFFSVEHHYKEIHKPLTYAKKPSYWSHKHTHTTTPFTTNTNSLFKTTTTTWHPIK